MRPEPISAADAARILGVTRATFAADCRAGRVPKSVAWFYGRKWNVDPERLLAWRDAGCPAPAVTVLAPLQAVSR